MVVEEYKVGNAIEVKRPRRSYRPRGMSRGAPRWNGCVLIRVVI